MMIRLLVMCFGLQAIPAFAAIDYEVTGFHKCKYFEDGDRSRLKRAECTVKGVFFADNCAQAFRRLELNNCCEYAIGYDMGESTSFTSLKCILVKE